MNSNFKKHLFLTILIVIGSFISLTTFSQTTIKGSIKDNKGVEIPYATILLKQSKNGGISDELGIFLITTETIGKDTIMVSSIGYDSFILPIYWYI